MIRNIKKNINNISNITANLIKYGVAFCCLIIIGASVFYTKNVTSVYYRPEITMLCKESVRLSVGMFAEIIIGAIIFDIYEKRTNK